jgi:hypothetical protein
MGAGFQDVEETNPRCALRCCGVVLAFEEGSGVELVFKPRQGIVPFMCVKDVRKAVK